MDKLLKSRQCAEYPPSVLVLSNRNQKALRLKQWLEEKGCRAYEVGTNAENLENLDQLYFELVVLDVEPDSGSATTGRGLKTIYQKLETEPELLDLPLVMLTNDTRGPATNRAQRPVYCLTKHQGAREQLLQIIEQTHYLARRYA